MDLLNSDNSFGDKCLINSLIVYQHFSDLQLEISDILSEICLCNIILQPLSIILALLY